MGMQKYLKEAFLDQALLALELEGELGTPFAYELAQKRAEQMVYLFENRERLSPPTDQELEEAEQYAEQHAESIGE